MNTPILSTRRRTSLAVLKDVTFGLLMRELKTRFGNYRMGYSWAIIDPLVAISVFCFIFGMRQRSGFGGVEAPVFIAASYLPFMMFQNVVSQLQSAVSANKGLFCYRQVTPFATLFSRFLLETLIGMVVAFVLILGLIWFGFDAMPADPLAVLTGYGLLMIFSFALGTLLCIVTSLSEEARKLIPILMRPMLWISAVFFPLAAVPQNYQHLLLWNPIVHALELIRTGWIAGFQTKEGSWIYLASTTLVLLTFAMSAYRLSHRRLIAS
ncbi:ABC transporter permease [Aeromonas hydrophila]|uniref:ABC transporter permease n=1 Tax=Aeromonas hydrophila TaxID=644 RepID=UPI001CF0235A|nr:ABC transporter permease [Aeromonas hydrophila]UCM63204.1 ABC transporter permease [Aeromonas hydrophila]